MAEATKPTGAEVGSIRPDRAISAPRSTNKDTASWLKRKLGFAVDTQGLLREFSEGQTRKFSLDWQKTVKRNPWTLWTTKRLSGAARDWADSHSASVKQKYDELKQQQNPDGNRRISRRKQFELYTKAVHLDRQESMKQLHTQFGETQTRGDFQATVEDRLNSELTGTGRMPSARTEAQIRTDLLREQAGDPRTRKAREDTEKARQDADKTRTEATKKALLAGAMSAPTYDANLTSILTEMNAELGMNMKELADAPPDRIPDIQDRLIKKYSDQAEEATKAQERADNAAKEKIKTERADEVTRVANDLILKGEASPQDAHDTAAGKILAEDRRQAHETEQARQRQITETNTLFNTDAVFRKMVIDRLTGKMPPSQADIEQAKSEARKEFDAKKAQETLPKPTQPVTAEQYSQAMSELVNADPTLLSQDQATIDQKIRDHIAKESTIEAPSSEMPTEDSAEQLRKDRAKMLESLGIPDDIAGGILQQMEENPEFAQTIDDIRKEVETKVNDLGLLPSAEPDLIKKAVTEGLLKSTKDGLTTKDKDSKIGGFIAAILSAMAAAVSSVGEAAKLGAGAAA